MKNKGFEKGFDEIEEEDETEREFEIMGYMDELGMTYDEAVSFYEVEHIDEEVY